MFDASDRDTSLPAAHPHQYSFAGIGDIERSGVSGSRASPGAARGEGDSRTNPTSVPATMFSMPGSPTRPGLVLSRDPTARELPVLRAFYKHALAKPSTLGFCECQHERIRQIAGQGNDAARELDALTAVGSVLFNLDAALNR